MPFDVCNMAGIDPHRIFVQLFYSTVGVQEIEEFTFSKVQFFGVVTSCHVVIMHTDSF